MNSLQDLLIPVYHENKVRVGTPDRDGGYVADPSLFTDRLVSVGCQNETTFEEAYLKINPNAKIDIYDGGGRCDLADKNDNVNFILKYITNMNDLTLYTNSVLQMDIEGHELKVLVAKPDLSSVTQLIIEIHLHMAPFYEAWRAALSHLNETHGLIHLHMNNHIRTEMYGVPAVLELTYVRKDCLTTPNQPDTRVYPLEMDHPNKLGDSYDPQLDWWLR
jgi:hypothetical protein